MAAKGVSIFLAFWSLLWARQISGQVNYALHQPAYQLGMFDVYHTPDKATDGNPSQDFYANQCAHTCPNCDGGVAAYPEYWLVQLSRWIIPTAVYIYWRSDMGGAGSTRDAAWTYHVGPFWNASLPNVVPTTLVANDPVGNGTFFFLRNQGVSLSQISGYNGQFNIQTRASGRYFAIRGNTASTDPCEVLVFGIPNLLNGTNVSVRYGNPPPAANPRVLTDESENTCWTVLPPNLGTNIFLDFNGIPNLTNNFTVAVLTLSTTPTKGSEAVPCALGMYIRIFTSENRTCSFLQSISSGNKNYFVFTCTCNACTGLTVMLFRRGAFAESMSICEVLAFNG